MRRFSTLPIRYAPRVKNRLDIAVNRQQKIPDLEASELARQRKQEKFNRSPVQNHSAVTLLEELLGKKFAPGTRIGPDTPFSKDEMDKIFRQPNVRLKYKVLGTSGNQLRNSKMVDRDVQKSLERKDIERAMWMARMARGNGIFAFGTILKWLFEEGHPNAALKLFNEFKKRGLIPNGRLLNVLFSGMPMTKERATLMRSIFQKELARDNSELNVYHVNSLLKDLRMAGDSESAIKLYDRMLKKKGFELDVRTYTEMFLILRHHEDFQQSIDLAERMFRRVQLDHQDEIDPYLIRAYSSLMFFSDDLTLKARCLTVLREWYRVCSIEEITTAVDPTNYDEVMYQYGEKVLTDPTVLLQLSDVNIKKHKRFDPDDTTLNRYDHLSSLFKVANTYRKDA